MEWGYLVFGVGVLAFMVFTNIRLSRIERRIRGIERAGRNRLKMVLNAEYGKSGIFKVVDANTLYPYEVDKDEE